MKREVHIRQRDNAISPGGSVARTLGLLAGTAVAILCSFCLGIPAKASAAPEEIASRIAEIDGVKLHYMTAGHGTPLILLYGYAETSLMWKPIIPVLAERFTVIAPDFPASETRTFQPTVWI